MDILKELICAILLLLLPVILVYGIAECEKYIRKRN